MAASDKTGLVAKTIELNGETYRYAVFVPESYTPQRRWPAILFMHGIGECGDDGMLQTTVGLGRAIQEHPERFPCIVIMPQCRVGLKWEGPMETLALAALDVALKEYRIDRDRIVLTGLSLGGFGTWSIGARHANRFCALVPICGGGDPADADQLVHIPIWCFHGDVDPVIPVRRSREMVQAVRAAGGDVTYTELADVAHNAWDPAYDDPELIAWMLARHR